MVKICRSITNTEQHLKIEQKKALELTLGLYCHLNKQELWARTRSRTIF